MMIFLQYTEEKKSSVPLTDFRDTRDAVSRYFVRIPDEKKFINVCRKWMNQIETDTMSILMTFLSFEVDRRQSCIRRSWISCIVITKNDFSKRSAAQDLPATSDQWTERNDPPRVVTSHVMWWASIETYEKYQSLRTPQSDRVVRLSY